MVSYDIGRIIRTIRELRVNIVGETKSPHKYLFLVTLARLYGQSPLRQNAFPLDDELELAFHDSCRDFYPDCGATSFLIELPYLHLATDRIWALKIRQGKEQAFRDYEARTYGRRLTRGRIIETTEYGSLCEEWDACLRDAQGRSAVLAELGRVLADIPAPRSGSGAIDSMPRLSPSRTDVDGVSNPFVAYLNSLQRLDANNDNALAESQCCSRFFPLIHVPHPLTDIILAELRNPAGRHVILTGHAGDGKSTIALEAYKRLSGIPADQSLLRQLDVREDLPDESITIIKDLSERLKGDDADLVRELLTTDRRLLLVSNTGTLLDLFRSQACAFGLSDVQLESDVLTAISEEGGEKELSPAGVSFRVFNLARMDNLELARQIFGRMVSPEPWAACDRLPCRAECPIRLNVDLITNHRDRVFDRIFLAYRRMYEYGTRLTLRQITEHLAYLITSGLDESDIVEMREQQQLPLKAQFMFFNRFFGDDGKADHTAALQMRAVQEIREQGFGERPCPVWERKLWLRLREGNFRLQIQDCDPEFDLLRAHGSGPGDDSQPGMTPDQAREQVRRMLYFLYDFSEGERSFLTHFLNSPMILRWIGWQQPGARLEMTERNALEQRVYHVLQEHFTGVRLPEGATGHDRRLYVTLSRRRNEIRQSAQVVLAQIDWSGETALELIPRQNAAGGERTDLELVGRGRVEGASLVLSLPFLDYVVMRHFGELGEILQPAYVARLERFKAQVQGLARQARSDVMLVRLKTDHTFRRQQYTVRDGGLEVNDVL